MVLPAIDEFLCSLFTIIVHCGNLPFCLRNCVLVPVLKPGKDSSCGDSYRPIAFVVILAISGPATIQYLSAARLTVSPIAPSELFTFVYFVHSTVIAEIFLLVLCTTKFLDLNLAARTSGCLMLRVTTSWMSTRSHLAYDQAGYDAIITH